MEQENERSEGGQGSGVSTESRRPAESRGGSSRGDGGERQERRRYSQLSDRGRCRFTRDKVKRIDYKDVATLQKLMTVQGKLLSRKRTGIAARYQRMVKIAVKRARYMALLPYIG